MTIPKYWAEARVQHRAGGRQITVRRFGWSNLDPAEAQTHAETRAAEAIRRLRAGEKLFPREPKVAYHGAEGVPIREEIVAQHGETILTRNSYGALCLNTPDVLFADVDFASELPAWVGSFLLAVLVVCSLGLGVGFQSWSLFFAVLIGGGLLGTALVPPGYKLLLRLRGGAEQHAKRNLVNFITTHPDWKLRLYRTPAGFRLLAMHRPFSPVEPETTEFFTALQADPVYVQMCQRQQCFRARVSPKPWRMGITTHLRPKPGIWPVRPEALPIRRSWIDAYDAKAVEFASCRFETELGQGAIHEHIRPVQQLHDQLCRAESSLALA